MAHKRVADVIVETLQAAGVKHCWGVPGDTLNFVTDAIRRSDIAWVHVRHEEVGGFAAGAEAMLTGRLTACAGSCGPGSLHFINGLFESHRNRSAGRADRQPDHQRRIGLRLSAGGRLRADLSHLQRVLR